MNFNNCGQYQQEDNFMVSASVNCLNATCVSASSSNLSLRANLGGGSEYSVPANLAEFNLGGDCNEGGYPQNTIRWELYLNGQKVRDSAMLGLGGAGASANSRCVNGRFLIYVNLNPINEDNVNRTGLAAPTPQNPFARSAYDLYIEVFGQDVVNGPAHRNTLKARHRVSLLAI